LSSPECFFQAQNAPKSVLGWASSVAGQGIPGVRTPLSCPVGSDEIFFVQGGGGGARQPMMTKSPGRLLNLQTCLRRWPGFCPGPRWGSFSTLPQTGWGGGYPSPFLNPNSPPRSTSSASRTRSLRRLGSQAPLSTKSWLRQCLLRVTRWETLNVLGLKIQD